MKRKIISAMLVALVAVSMIGCGENANSVSPSNQESTSTQESSETSQTTSKEEAKTVTVAFASGGKTLNPTQATDGISAVFINAAYDQLVTYGSTTDENGYDLADTTNIQPSLAKSWSISEDGLEYKIELDENATFANGDDVTADAVIYSFNRIKESNYTGFLYSLANIETMEKIDEKTIQFTLSKPCTIFFNLLQMHIFSIVNPNELEGMSEEEIDTFLTNTTVGSGAYSIDKWEATSEAILTARDAYWKGKVNIDKVTVKVIAEASNRVLLANSGDVDIALNIPPKDLSMLEENESLSVRDYQSVGIVYLSMNTTKEPFNNVLVRQAINYAMPYDSIVEDVMSNKAKKLDLVVPSAMPSHITDASVTYAEDLEKAKELLEEAGYQDGFDIELTVSSSNQDDEDAAILIQGNLAKIGIKVEIKKLERAQYLEAVNAQNFDLAVAGYTAFVNDPGYFFGNCLYSKGEYNYGAYASEEVDAIWEEAEASNELEIRYDLYEQAQRIVAKDAAWAPLYEKSTIVVLNNSVASYKHYPDGALRFAEITK